jgi:hypothetical protein
MPPPGIPPLGGAGVPLLDSSLQAAVMKAATATSNSGFIQLKMVVKN